jgi:hypothetical protein
MVGIAAPIRKLLRDVECGRTTQAAPHAAHEGEDLK